MNTLKTYFQKLKEKIKPATEEDGVLSLVPEFEIMVPTEKDTLIWNFIRDCKERTAQCENEVNDPAMNYRACAKA